MGNKNTEQDPKQDPKQNTETAAQAELGDEELDGVSGGVRGNYFVADSFSFGVEREMKESGEKGGTADINIGVGELVPSTLNKSRR